MMKRNGAQIVAEALIREGVTHGFGIPGTHNIELYDALASKEAFTSVLVGDEQGASFMADGYARASGRLAVVNVVPGAGLTHALSGVAEAFMDQVPMLVLACGIRRDTGNAYQLHDIDQVSVARPVCKRVFQPLTHNELIRAVREACRTALTPPMGPALVEVPANLYLFTAEVSPDDSGIPPLSLPAEPDAEAVRRAVELVNRCGNIGIYAGAGAQEAGKDLIELAEKLDAVVCTTISGKGVFPEDHPRFAWNALGAAAPPGIRKIANAFDCLIAVGCRFGEVATASYGLKPPENLVHIDVDPGVFNRNYPARVTITADAGLALRAMLAHPELKKKRPVTAKLVSLADAHAEVRSFQAEARTPGKVSPKALFDALSEVFGPETAYVTDSGNGTFLAMEHLRLTRPRSFLGPIDYSCMGYSVPAAIGAKLACPERPVVALVGDGAFLMTGLELVTAANYGVGAVFIILRDGELSQIAQFQRTSLNRETCTRLYELDFSHVAAAARVDYLSLGDDGEAMDVLRRAADIAAQHRPVLVEADIAYSRPTFFSKGVVKTNFLRFPWKDRFRLIGRVVKRRLGG